MNKRGKVNLYNFLVFLLCKTNKAMIPQFKGLQTLVTLGLIFAGLLFLAVVGAIIYGITLLF